MSKGGAILVRGTGTVNAQIWPGSGQAESPERLAREPEGDLGAEHDHEEGDDLDDHEIGHAAVDGAEAPLGTTCLR